VTNSDYPSRKKTCIAVVSPFLDKQHGTERCVAEQIERLAQKYEIHLYSSDVRDVDLSRITWHRVPSLPGPHVFGYCWWFVANHAYRWWDRLSRQVMPDITYSPGINCFDADVISVHIVFAEFYRRTRQALRFVANPVRFWPRLLHRRIYYRLIISLEHLVYRRKRSVLSAVSTKCAQDLRRYGRQALPVIFNGIDAGRFRPKARRQRRDAARKVLGVGAADFCLLLVGNDWKKKGLDCLLEALGQIENPSVRLLVVGRDSAEPFRERTARLALNNRVAFLPPRPDVEFYYAAADLYVGPSLEDAFGLPQLEAMACGVPCIVSSHAGVSEIITDGVDGLIIRDCDSHARLAELITVLYRDGDLCKKMGEAAARTARHYSWDRNAEQLNQLFEGLLCGRDGAALLHTRTADQIRPAAESCRSTPRPDRPLLGKRIAVVSPFLDKLHGTERRASELIERLAQVYGYEIHIYSQRVRDIAGVELFEQAQSNGPGRVLWHKLPKVPGPHLVNYGWWFVTNHLWRWWDRRIRGLKYDLTYSPGINCLDADVVSVHIIFDEFYRQVRSDLRLRANALSAWPRIIHRRIYYRLIILLEKLIYPRTSLRAAAISRKTREDLIRIRGGFGDIAVIYGGVDRARFNPDRRRELRLQARQAAGLASTTFTLLLVGNDWKKKGLDYLLKAIGRLQNSGISLLIAGHDSIEPFRNVIKRYGLERQLVFVPIRPDVEFYYAAADAYVCSSLEDAFAFPPFEAMACGLPVIASNEAGVSELITDGVDGLLLKDPRNGDSLAGLISKLRADPGFGARLGQRAAETAAHYSWERNAQQFEAMFSEIIRRNRSADVLPLAANDAMLEQSSIADHRTIS
jgi:UDP-glucose:(heptosyl)LPS alpha-1,3-glucosyltransferase